MRRQRMLTTVATRNLCACCTARLATTRTSPHLLGTAVRRHYLSTSRNVSQFSSHAVSTKDDGDNNQDWGWDSPNASSSSQATDNNWIVQQHSESSLSPEEARQRELLMARFKAPTTSPSENSTASRPSDKPPVRPGNRHRDALQFQQRQNRRGPPNFFRPDLNKPDISSDGKDTAPEWKQLKKRQKLSKDEIQALLRNESSPSTMEPRRRGRDALRSGDPIDDFIKGKQQNGYVSLRGRPRPSTSDADPSSSLLPPRNPPSATDQDGHSPPPKSTHTHDDNEATRGVYWRTDDADKPTYSKRTQTKVKRNEEEDERHPGKRWSKRSGDEEEERRPDRRRTRKDDEEEGYAEKPRRGRKPQRDEDEDEADYRKVLRAERRRAKEEKKKARLTQRAPAIPISLPEYISVANLATALKVRNDVFLGKLEELGYENPQNDHILTSEDASLIAMEYNFQPTFQTAEDARDLFPMPVPEDKSSLPARPPVVTIMGHVDHGKTTILDFLRNSSVAASEFGGITQHIGAFSVPLASGKTITFLDTPGHAAFLNMRQRGANVTDIVILVVAADDSVMPQTIEAIKHAQRARVPIIVAINKIDKEEAAPEQVKADLARHGIEVEDFGGETQAICVSGKTGKGMEELEEAVVTLSEILDHRADPTGQVEGWILEASTKKSGRVATVLVRRGTLRPGDVLVAGSTWTRVRCLKNEAGALMDEAGPGMPAEIDGWRGSPEAGDEVLQAPDEEKATSVVEYRTEVAERKKLAEDMEVINESRKLEAAKRVAKETGEPQPEDKQTHSAPQEASSGLQLVPFIIKADVSGSAEAVVDYISSIGNAEVAPNILRSGVGSVSEFDVEHAAAARGHIISFNCAIEPRIAQMASEKGVRILDHNIIYRVIEDVKTVLSELLKPIVVQKVTGEAEVAQLFSINVKGRKQIQIAGCKIRNGIVTKNSKVRVLRGKETVYDGTISSLKNQKKDVSEMRKGNECGISVEGWDAFQEGDQLQCYDETEEKRHL